MGLIFLTIFVVRKSSKNCQKKSGQIYYFSGPASKPASTAKVGTGFRPPLSNETAIPPQQTAAPSDFLGRIQPAPAAGYHRPSQPISPPEQSQKLPSDPAMYTVIYPPQSANQKAPFSLTTQIMPSQPIRSTVSMNQSQAMRQVERPQSTESRSSAPSVDVVNKGIQ